MEIQNITKRVCLPGGERVEFCANQPTDGDLRRISDGLAHFARTRNTGRIPVGKCSTVRRTLDLRESRFAGHGVNLMKGTGVRSLGYGGGVLALVLLGWILTGGASSPRQQGMPMDWTHRHVIFSQPSTDAQLPL